jgi:ligand-binding sensor domain-containing protein
MKMIYLLLLSVLHFSCADQQATEKEGERSSALNPAGTDTLKFSSGIRAIFEDSKGRYWVGSLQEGVAVWDGRTWTYFTQEDGLPDNQIHAIKEDSNGLLWFATQTGISSYDGTKMRIRTPLSQPSTATTFQAQGNSPQPGKWLKLKGDLWFEAGNRSGVYRYDGKRLQYLELPKQKVLNPSDNLFAVTGIAEGKNRTWFGTYAGVFGYNGFDFTPISDETLGYDRTVEALHIRSIFEDSKGRLWIGNNGIGVLLKEGDSIHNFSRQQGLIHPNSQRKGEKSPSGTLEHVFTLAEDKNGNIWFGDRDTGIWKYDGATMTNYGAQDGLANPFALSIFETKQGDLWFGMADGKVYRFNGNRFERLF